MVAAGEAMLPPQLSAISGGTAIFHPCLSVKINQLPHSATALAGFIFGDNHSAPEGWVVAEGGLQILSQKEDRALVVVSSW